MSTITIIAGGWSVSQFDLRKLPGTIIAVNDAALYAPRWDIALSMDRLWAENRWNLIKANQGKQIWLRRSTMKNISAEGLPHIVEFECDHTSVTLSDEPGRLNGTHSGFCALNLAYSMRPEAIYLLGFDMELGPKGERHWYPPYPWKNGGGSGAGRLNAWGREFSTAAGQFVEIGCRVFVAGRGHIAGFERIERSQLEIASRET